MSQQVQQEHLSIINITPRLVVRTIFFIIVCPMIYRETGLVTTILVGILYLEVAIKTDLLNAMHELQMNLYKSVKGILEFQNEYISTRIKNTKKKKFECCTVETRML